MLLHFTLDEHGFRCEDAPAIAAASTINYIKCHFDFRDEAWKSLDAVVAIFKSATYNVVAEVLLDSNNDCFIEPNIYKRGGNIQVKLVGDKYISDSVHSTTHVSAISEFYIKENVITPTVTPSKYDVFVAELEIAQNAVNAAISDIYQKAADGEFDGADGVGIASVSYNADGTVNVTLTDGTTFTSEYSMKGAKGDAGETGVGISNVLYGQDGTLTITMSDGTIYTSEYSMKGPKGDQGNTGESGEKGDPGFSPIANVSRSGNTVTISITDVNGTTTADVLDGEKGDKGDTGDTGATGNGIVSITKTGTVGLIDTYTITYTNGATDTFQVKNGENGSGSVSDVWVDDVSVVSGGIARITSPTASVALSVVTFTLNENDGTATADKTVAQLYQDWLAGKAIIGAVLTHSADVRDAIYCSLVEVYTESNYISLRFEISGPYIDGTNLGLHVLKLDFDNNGNGDTATYELHDYSLVQTTRTINGKALSSNITLSASDVDALPASTSIPSALSDLTNDMALSDFTNDVGYLTSYTETDPTVPAWAKAASKPSYTAAEVGAQPILVSGTNIKTVTGTSLLGSGDLLPSAVGYTTVIPTAANTTGLKFVLCDSEPSTKYDGWVYLIKES